MNTKARLFGQIQPQGIFFTQTKTEKNCKSPEPVIFFDKLISNNIKFTTIVEEIHSGEDKSFYQTHSGHSEAEKSSAGGTPDHKKILPNSGIKSQGGKKFFLLPRAESCKRNFFPSPSSKIFLTSSHQKSLQSFVSNCQKIDKIITVCGENCKNGSSPTMLNSCIEKNRKIAVKYAKDINWTSTKINEFNGHNSEVMKKLFEESKDSYKHSELDKLKSSENFNNRSLKDYKEKAKSIKKLLNKYKNRIFY